MGSLFHDAFQHLLIGFHRQDAVFGHSQRFAHQFFFKTVFYHYWRFRRHHGDAGKGRLNKLAYTAAAQADHTHGDAGHGHLLAQLFPLQEFAFQVAHLSLTGRTGAGAVTLVGTFLRLVFNLVSLCNLLADGL